MEPIGAVTAAPRAAPAGRPWEATEFLTALQDLPSSGLTTCDGRSVHSMGAHMAAAYEEVIRHVEAYADGRPLARTRTFEEREPPYRAMSPGELSKQVELNEERMRHTVEDLLEVEPDATMRWTGRMVKAKGFLSHLRNEAAVHRWDMVGDDEMSWRLLGQQELIEHSVNFVGAGPLYMRGMVAGAGRGRPISARLRSTDEQPDVVIEVRGRALALGLAPQDGEPTATADPAARLLTLWGRKPMPPGRLRANAPMDEVTRLQWLLSGY